MKLLIADIARDIEKYWLNTIKSFKFIEYTPLILNNSNIYDIIKLYYDSYKTINYI